MPTVAASERAEEGPIDEVGVRPALRDHLLYALIIAVYCLPFIADRDLFYRDESRYGGVVREMIENHSWFTLTIGGDFYSDKPPLFFTLIRLASEITGTIAPWVFFVVVMATAFVFVAGSDAFLRAAGYDRRIVRTANLLILGVPWIAVHMQTVRMDLLFSGLILFSLAAYAQGMRRASANALPLLGGLLAGLAVMVKGPFGAVIPILSLIGFAGLSRNLRMLLRGDMLASLIAMAIPVLAWFAILYASFGGHAFDLILNEQIVERIAEGRDSSRPFYLYPLWIAFTLMPWLMLAPLLLTKRLRALVFDGEATRDWSGPSPGLRLVLPCLVATALALGVVAQKNIHYLLPLVPPLMVLVAVAYRRLDDAAPIFLDWFYVGLAIVALAGPPVALWALGFASEGDRANLFAVVDPATLDHVVAALSLSAIPLAIGGRLRGTARLLSGVASVAVMLFAVKAILLPDIDRVMSPRHVAERFEPEIPPGAPVIVYGIYPGSLSYHFDHPLTYVEGRDALRQALAQDAPRYIVTSRGRFEREAELRDGFAIAAENPLESLTMVLLERVAP
jgi:4-amino-4-deoxy-L-arabinose transferase-like glycosyltransferase